MTTVKVGAFFNAFMSCHTINNIMSFDVIYNKEKLSFEFVGRSGCPIALVEQQCNKRFSFWSLFLKWKIKSPCYSQQVIDDVVDYQSYRVDPFDPIDQGVHCFEKRIENFDQSFPDSTVMVYRNCPQGKGTYKVELYDSHKDVSAGVDVDDIAFGISLPNVDILKKNMPTCVTHEMATTLPLIAKMLKLVSGTASQSVYTTAFLEYFYNCFAYDPDAEVDVDTKDIFKEFEIYNLARARGTLNIFCDSGRFMLILKDMCLDIKDNRIQHYKRRKTPMNQNIPLFHKIQKLHQPYRRPICSLRNPCEITPDTYYRLTTNVSSKFLVV